jgi:hypothetical protein
VVTKRLIGGPASLSEFTINVYAGHTTASLPCSGHGTGASVQGCSTTPVPQFSGFRAVGPPGQTLTLPAGDEYAVDEGLHAGYVAFFSLPGCNSGPSGESPIRTGQTDFCTIYNVPTNGQQLQALLPTFGTAVPVATCLTRELKPCLSAHYLPPNFHPPSGPHRSPPPSLHSGSNHP